MNTNELRILRESFIKAIEPVARRKNYLGNVIHSEEHYNILVMARLSKYVRINKLREKLLEKERLYKEIYADILQQKYRMIDELKGSTYPTGYYIK